ncbi:MAG: 4a-hydroxytetrahydrobiopterin dehydratase [Thermoleophilaceae bacterium]
MNKVTVALSTHSERGLAENDCELARRISALA